MMVVEIKWVWWFVVSGDSLFCSWVGWCEDNLFSSCLTSKSKDLSEIWKLTQTLGFQHWVATKIIWRQTVNKPAITSLNQIGNSKNNRLLLKWNTQWIRPLCSWPLNLSLLFDPISNFKTIMTIIWYLNTNTGILSRSRDFRIWTLKWWIWWWSIYNGEVCVCVCVCHEKVTKFVWPPPFFPNFFV